MIITTPISGRVDPGTFTSGIIDDWEEAQKPIHGQEILVPTFEIAVNPTIQLSEVKARRFYIIDQAQINAKEAIQKEEDQAIFDAISSILPPAEELPDDIFTPISESSYWGN